MDDSLLSVAVRKKLSSMIASHGVRVCDDRQRCAAMLRDYCSESRQATVRILLNALQDGIVSELLNPVHAVPIEVELNRFATRLERSWGLSEEVAYWVVQTWAIALGRIPEPVTEISVVTEHSTLFRQAQSTTGDLPEVGPTALCPDLSDPKLPSSVVEVEPHPRGRPFWRLFVPALLLLSACGAGYALRAYLWWSAAHFGFPVGLSTQGQVVSSKSADRPAASAELPTQKKAAEFQEPEAERETKSASISLPKVRTSKTTGMRMRLIPSGTFQMGSPSSEKDRNEDEGPQHTVRISTAFYLGECEVTQSDYQQVMSTNPSYFSNTGGGSDKVKGLDTSRFPVEQVSWFDAVSFCNRLSELDGYPAYYTLQDVERKNGTIRWATVTAIGGSGYRLPTEAEWEYACRGNTTTAFHFGATSNGSESNVDGNSPYGTTMNGESLHRPTSVGSYPNVNHPFGLLDLHGNVWEWCEDIYDKELYAHRSGVTIDPRQTSGSDTRVLRGGSWDNEPRLTRSADRGRFTPNSRDYVIGFRVARKWLESKE